VPGQDDAYNYALKMFGHTSQWMALFDIDEFFVLKKHSTINEFLEGLSEFDQILLFWKLFGHSGHRQKPEGMVISNFLMCNLLLTNISKAIVRPEKVLFANPHNCVTHTGLTINDIGTPLKETWRHQELSEENLVIHHYFTKSYSEYEKKIQRGQADGRSEKKLDPYEKWDFSNSNTDAAIHAERVAAEYSRINNLGLNSISFASQSRLSRYSSQRGFLLKTQQYVENIAKHLNSEYFNSDPLKIDHYYFGTCLQFPKMKVDLERQCIKIIRQNLTGFYQSCKATLSFDCLIESAEGRLQFSNTKNINISNELTFEALNDDPQINFLLATQEDVGRYAVVFVVRQPEPGPIDVMIFGRDYHGEECMSFRNVHHESGGIIFGVISVGAEAMYANKIRLDPGSTPGEYGVLLYSTCRYI